MTQTIKYSATAAILFSRAGYSCCNVGTRGTGDSQFQHMYSIAVNPADTIVYTSDIVNNNIQKFAAVR